MPIYDYRCGNADCPRYCEHHTLLCKVDERDDQRCGFCGVTLDRLPSAPRTTFKFADKSGIKRGTK